MKSQKRTPGGHQASTSDTNRTPLLIMVSANRKFTIRTDRGSALVPVVLEVRISGKKYRKVTGVSVAPAKWNKTTQRIRPSQGSAEANAILDTIDIKVLELFTSYAFRQITPTIERFKTDFDSQASSGNFLAFAREHLDRETIAPSTYKKISSALNIIEQYRPALAFSDIDIDFLRDFDRFLQRKRNNGPGGRNKNLKVLRKYVARAVESGFIRIDPFFKFKIPTAVGNREALTPDQLRQVFDLFHAPNTPPTWKNILQQFLFSCFTGIRPGDHLRIRRAHFQNGYIVFMPAKTLYKRKTVRIPAPAILNNILNPTDPIFDFIYSPQVANRHLKSIALFLNIPIPVSLYTGRHTFATMYLFLGGKVEELRELMGHSDIATTMVYVHIADAWKKAGMNRFDSFFG
jgi:integrase